MKVPFTPADFLDRAEQCYPQRTGVVDEPGEPQDGGGGRMTYAGLADHVRALAAGLDRLGVGRGERVAVVSHNSARLLELFFAVTVYGRVLVPINFRLSRDEVAYIVEHCGASVLLVDPELDAALADVTAPHRFVLGRESDAALLVTGTEPVRGRTRTRTPRPPSTTRAARRPGPRACRSRTATSG
jgi:acyl-CoA synthetase (AMP-forming)/AMP-acid ligase II